MSNIPIDMNKTLEQVVDTNSRIAEDKPEYWEAFLGFAKQSLSDGALSHKTKELIAVALAINEHCSYCIAMHVKSAIDAGATRDEIMETAYVASLMGGGPSVAYLRYVIDACDQFNAE